MYATLAVGVCYEHGRRRRISSRDAARAACVVAFAARVAPRADGTAHEAAARDAACLELEQLWWERGIWDGDPVQGGELRELLGGSGVAEQAVVDGELG